MYLSYLWYKLRRVVKSSKIRELYQNKFKPIIIFTHVKLLKLLAFISFLLYVLNINVSSSSAQPQVKLIFNEKNASVNIKINNTYYFSLSFTRIYLGKQSFKGMAKELKNMKIKFIKAQNEKMGNYTEVLMWKNLKIREKGCFGRNNEVNVTLRFYISEKEYYKKEVKIKRNMLRYDILIYSNSSVPFFLLEEKINVNNQSQEVYEYSDENGARWKAVRMVHEPMKHRFGNHNLGMIKFGKGNGAIKHMWEYEENVETFYYTNSDFHLIFSFKNENGSVIYDPYISLPVDLSPNLKPIIEGERVVNYLMDHFFSFFIGLIVAVAVIFIPYFKRR